jgi:hypothetical protein
MNPEEQAAPPMESPADIAQALTALVAGVQAGEMTADQAMQGVAAISEQLMQMTSMPEPGADLRGMIGESMAQGGMA